MSLSRGGSRLQLWQILQLAKHRVKAVGRSRREASKAGIEIGTEIMNIILIGREIGIEVRMAMGMRTGRVMDSE